jgi:hypothetical protein
LRDCLVGGLTRPHLFINDEARDQQREGGGQADGRHARQERAPRGLLALARFGRGQARAQAEVEVRRRADRPQAPDQTPERLPLVMEGPALRADADVRARALAQASARLQLLDLGPTRLTVHDDLKPPTHK